MLTIYFRGRTAFIWRAGTELKLSALVASGLMSEPSGQLSPIFIGDSSAFGGPQESSRYTLICTAYLPWADPFQLCDDAFVCVDGVLQDVEVIPISGMWKLEI